jgi:hypothetical protein
MRSATRSPLALHNFSSVFLKYPTAGCGTVVITYYTTLNGVRIAQSVQ